MNPTIRPRRSDEKLPADSGELVCLWPGCDWRNGFLAVERSGDLLGAACTMHRFMSPQQWASALDGEDDE